MASNIMRYKVKVEGCPLLMLFLLLQATNLLESVQKVTVCLLLCCTIDLNKLTVSFKCFVN